MTARPPQALVLTRPVGSSVMVECLDRRARQIGLRAGMSLGQARALAPGLLAWPHQPQRDRQALRRLANWTLRFSPLVEPVEPNTLLIDTTGCERLFGGQAKIARAAVDGLEREGFCARAATADTVGTAYALAFAGKERVTIVPPGRTRAYLAPLPPAALRIDGRVGARLESLGLRTIGDLLMLPRASLPARFGPQLVLRLQQALGEVFEGVGTHQVEEAPHARAGFERPVHHLSVIQPVASDLLGEIFEQMRRRGRALRRLDCVLAHEFTPPTALSIGFSRASRSQAHAAELLRQRLEQIDLSAGVCGLTLVACETSRWSPPQRELFEPGQPGEQEQLGDLIDRLVNHLGAHAVLRPQLVDDYQPEVACRYVSVAETGVAPADGAGGLVASPGCRSAGTRPVQLLARPIPIRVIALVPDGPPTWFAYRGREYVVADSQGPERLETAWWRGADVRRDYFRVTTETGEQFWIFHAFDQRRWYVHGVFA